MGLAGLCGMPSMAAAAAPSTQRGWQEEFDDLCSKTQDAMTLSVEELTALLQRCDALLPEIEKLDDTRKKVFGDGYRGAEAFIFMCSIQKRTRKNEYWLFPLM